MDFLIKSSNLCLKKFIIMFNNLILVINKKYSMLRIIKHT